jgi:hypothetical protein
MVKFVGTPDLDGLDSFEVTFRIDDELMSRLMDGDDDDDEF